MLKKDVFCGLAFLIKRVFFDPSLSSLHARIEQRHDALEFHETFFRDSSERVNLILLRSSKIYKIRLATKRTLLP